MVERAPPACAGRGAWAEGDEHEKERRNGGTEEREKEKKDNPEERKGENQKISEESRRQREQVVIRWKPIIPY